MARSIWSGAISFGLVNIPVKLVSAVSPKDVRFHLLHDADGVRLQQKRICPADGEEVPWEHVVKGYEVRKGQYVRVTAEELEAIDTKATHTIDIERFVDLGEIDPIYYESTYHVVPDRGAARPYALLLAAMEKSGRVAIARMVLRTKQYLVALRAGGGHALVMSTLYFEDELVPVGELEGVPAHLGAEKSPLAERELAMAEQLIESLSSAFDPAEFKDEYRERVLALVQQKAEGAELETQPTDEPRAQVMDLATALRQSLERSRKTAPTSSQTSPSPKSSATPSPKSSTTANTVERKPARARQATVANKRPPRPATATAAARAARTARTHSARRAHRER